MSSWKKLCLIFQWLQILKETFKKYSFFNGTTFPSPLNTTAIKKKHFFCGFPNQNFSLVMISHGFHRLLILSLCFFWYVKRLYSIFWKSIERILILMTHVKKRARHDPNTERNKYFWFSEYRTVYTTKETFSKQSFYEVNM